MYSLRVFVPLWLIFPALPKDTAYDGGEVGHGEVRGATGAGKPFGFAPGIDEGGAAPGTMTRFDIIENIADHP